MKKKKKKKKTRLLKHVQISAFGVVLNEGDVCALRCNGNHTLAFTVY